MKFTNRIVLFWAIVIISCALLLAFLPSWISPSKSSPTISNFCSLPICNDESIRIWNGGDSGTDACTNFYKLVCGSSLKEYVNSDHKSISQLSILQSKISQPVKKYLASSISPNDSISIQKIKSFYEKCNKKDENKLSSILKFIDSLGGWPLVQVKGIENNPDYSLDNIMMRLKAANIDFDIPFEIRWNEKNNMIEIWPAKTFMRSIISDEKDFEKIFQEISSIANFLGGDKEMINRELYVMYDLELEMQEKHLQSQEERLYSVGGLLFDFPYVNWKLLLGQIPLTRTVILHNIHQAQKISALMRIHRKSIANYLIWYVISPYAKFIQYERRLSEFQKYNRLSSAQVITQRSKACYNLASESIAFNAFYANNFAKHSKNEIEIMYSTIFKEAEFFLARISRKGETSYRAIQKLRNLKSMLSYPDYLMEENIINAYYGLIRYEDSTSFDLYMDIKKIDSKIVSHLSKYKNINIKTKFDIQIAHTDVGYFPLFHKIIIPAGILQIPYYDAGRPNYLNYGGIGFAMGHEIVHATDFRDKTKEQCLIRQFSNYRLAQINDVVDGLLTLDENYADHVGLQLAYNAYKVWRDKQHKEELRLLHFRNYTAAQMFWISAAGLSCEYDNDENLKKAIKRDEHSPGEARVNVGFAINKDIARDFQCPLGSEMNPINEC